MIHAYKLAGFNIIVDIASGSVHCVDDVAYDVICMNENRNREEVADYVSEKYGDIDRLEIHKILDDVEELKSRGKLFSADFYADATYGAQIAVPKALCLNVSHLCNMRCSYCFACNGEYGGGGLMPLETGKRAIDFLVENSKGRRRLDVDFFGGEPLLNWETVKRIVEYARSIEHRSGKIFRFTLTTNGLLIDADVIDFSNREMENIVLSLDGRPEINDSARKLCDGGGSYAEIVPKIRRLVEARDGKNYYIRGTYTRDNLDFTDDILHIADLGFTELSMEPVVASPGSPLGLAAEHLPELCEQYEKLAIEMLTRKKEGRGFKFYHFQLDLKHGPCAYKRIAGCGVGTEYMAVTPAGELYPCHRFVGDEKFLIGDVWRGVINNKLRDEFSECSIYSRNECRGCWARMYCSGGCAANAYHDSGSIGGVYSLGCEMFKKRIECAIMMKAAEAPETHCAITQPEGGILPDRRA